MIVPSKVKAAAGKKEEENWKFRTFLKGHADIDKLDEQFLSLHNELFDGYDCSQCRNCCRAFDAELQDEEIGQIAAVLGLAKADFIAQRLTKSDDGYIMESPCCFLNEDGSCAIEGNRPKTCKEFPFTNKPGRLWSLINVVTFAEECPIVYEMLERLKEIYHFKKNR
jgi:Fe-S-cluster containining protein